MLHKSRLWGVFPCEAGELIEKFQEHSWTLCTAFQTPAGTIWANDSTGPDAIQEFAILRPAGGGLLNQVESITVSWCDALHLRQYIDAYDAGEEDGKALYGFYDAERFEIKHRPCCYCR